MNKDIEKALLWWSNLSTKEKWNKILKDCENIDETLSLADMRELNILYMWEKSENIKANLDFNKIIESGGKITSIVGTAAEVYPQLIGKTVAFATTVGYFNFDYVIEVESVEEKEHEFALKGTFISKDKKFKTENCCGKKVVCLFWVIEYPE